MMQVAMVAICGITRETCNQNWTANIEVINLLHSIPMIYMLREQQTMAKSINLKSV